MDKSEYQLLRYQVEIAINDFERGCVDSPDLLNNLMRLFLQTSSASQVKHARARRDFLTFRRDPDLQPPPWAFRKPSLGSSKHENR